MLESERDLSAELAAFLRQRAALSSSEASRWVVFAGDKFQGSFAEYEDAARFAIDKFHDSTFLVRNLDVEEEYVPLIFAEAG